MVMFLVSLNVSQFLLNNRQFEYYNVVTLEILECGKSDFPGFVVAACCGVYLFV